MNRNDVVKYLQDNNIKHNNLASVGGSKKFWAEMYEVVFEFSPRKSARKSDIIYELVRYAEQQARANSMRV